MRALILAVVLGFAAFPALAQEVSGVNWLYFGLSTGKNSETVYSGVYKTRAECLARDDGQDDEDNVCYPIPALPDAYWTAVDDARRAQERGDRSPECMAKKQAYENSSWYEFQPRPVCDPIYGGN